MQVMAKTQRVMILVELRGVTEEFMVQLTRVVKDAKADEKCCYHCNSPEHFICNCPLVRSARDKKQLNGKEGTASMKGAWIPFTMTSATKSPRQRFHRHKNNLADSLLESKPFSVMVQNGKCR